MKIVVCIKRRKSWSKTGEEEKKVHDFLCTNAAVPLWWNWIRVSAAIVFFFSFLWLLLFINFDFVVSFGLLFSIFLSLFFDINIVKVIFSSWGMLHYLSLEICFLLKGYKLSILCILYRFVGQVIGVFNIYWYIAQVMWLPMSCDFLLL